MSKRDFEVKASAAVEEVEVPVEENTDDGRTNAGEYEDEEEDTELPPAATSPVEPTIDSDPEFRAFCLNNPDAIHEFTLDQLIADPARNGRFKERTIKDPSVKELAEMIKANSRGQITPGEVTLAKDGKLYLTAGTGRYLALQLINSTRGKADKLPFKALVIVEAEDGSQSIIDNAMENWGRLDLGPLDKALIVSRLMNPAPVGLGWNTNQVAQKLGIKKPEISVLRKIAGFPEQVTVWIGEGKITAHAAYDLAMVEPDKIEDNAKKLIDAAGGKRVSRSMAAGERLKKTGKKGGNGCSCW